MNLLFISSIILTPFQSAKYKLLHLVQLRPDSSVCNKFWPQSSFLTSSAGVAGADNFFVNNPFEFLFIFK